MDQGRDDGCHRTNGPSQVEFCRLYEAYFPRLMAYVLSRLPQREVAEDIVAEAFLRAYLHWDSLRNKGAVESWLFSIAHNLLVSYVRAQARTSRWWEQAERIDDSPEEAALDQDERRRMWKAMARLPQRYQQVLSLRFELGLCHRQVAQVMGVSEGNARVLLLRALRRLRAIMSQGEAIRHGAR